MFLASANPMKVLVRDEGCLRAQLHTSSCYTFHNVCRSRSFPTKAVIDGLDIQTAVPSLEVLSYMPLHGSEGLSATQSLLHLADIAPAPVGHNTGQGQDNGWLTPLVDSLEFVLRNIQTQLDRLRVPYSYGWSIVALTAFVKLITFPLTKQQVESSLAMQNLKPEIDAIKEKYGDDKDAVQRETSALYEKAGVNPLAGCLPTLATIPIFIGLYRSLTAFTSQGDLENQGFYWIPSLAGPTSISAQKAGAGIAWLVPLVEGAPPVGWETAGKYLILPTALVVAQWISSAIVAPPVDPNSDNANVQKALYLGLPLMVGWFALNVPSGLSLYYFSNTVFTSAIQIYLKKLGGAKTTEFDLGPVGLGKARRTGSIAEEEEGFTSFDIATESAENLNAAPSIISEQTNGTSSLDNINGMSEELTTVINRRCKRKKRELLDAR